MFTLTTQCLLLGTLGSAVLGWLMFFLSVFLILLILVQRGKGGGLTGALGGPGGQSAFGSKAGDTFTLITAVSAIIWGFVCAIAMYTLGVPPLTAEDASFEIDETPAITAPDTPAGESTGSGGLSGLSDLFPDEPAEPGDGESENGADEGGTPSMELTPAETSTTPPATEAPTSEAAPAAETETAPAAEAETAPAAGSQETPAAATDETPAGQ